MSTERKIATFEFGPQYLLLDGSGSDVCFPTLDAFLSRLGRDYSNPRSVYAPLPCWSFREKRTARSLSFVERVLQVQPKLSGANWQIYLNLPLWVNLLRERVTLYNLRGEWLGEDMEVLISRVTR